MGGRNSKRDAYGGAQADSVFLKLHPSRFGQVQWGEFSSGLSGRYEELLVHRRVGHQAEFEFGWVDFLTYAWIDLGWCPFILTFTTVARWGITSPQTLQLLLKPLGGARHRPPGQPALFDAIISLGVVLGGEIAERPSRKYFS
jgi:hypothetical protein